MRLIANENVPLESIGELRAKGFDIASATDTPGEPDLNVIERKSAEHEDRILLTFDKDFGQLAVRERRAISGVILLRMPPMSPEYITARLLSVLGGSFPLEDRFTVVTANRIRSRPLLRPNRQA